MAKSDLRQKLEKRADWGGIKLRIPAILLSPKYQKLGQGRDMFLVLDDLQQIRIRWAGQCLETYHPLTPRQAEKLLGAVEQQVAKYRTDLRVFSRFIASVGELTPKDECPIDRSWRSDKQRQLEKEDGAPKIAVETVKHQGKGGKDDSNPRHGIRVGRGSYQPHTLHETTLHLPEVGRKSRYRSRSSSLPERT